MKRKTKITTSRRQIVFARDRWTCGYCYKSAVSFEVVDRNFRPYVIPIGSDGHWMEIDHVIPYRKTQDNSIENLITSCFSCNNKKA
jgi:5-methylcytosine-specific restriction endonuclease McrA